MTTRMDFENNFWEDVSRSLPNPLPRVERASTSCSTNTAPEAEPAKKVPTPTTGRVTPHSSGQQSGSRSSEDKSPSTSILPDAGGATSSSPDLSFLRQAQQGGRGKEEARTNQSQFVSRASKPAQSSPPPNKGQKESLPPTRKSSVMPSSS